MSGSLGTATTVRGSLDRIGCITGLDREQTGFLQRLGRATHSGHARSVLAQPGERVTRVVVMLHGWAARVKTLPEGKRQIVGFLIPGDISDPDILTRDTRACSVILLTDCLYVIIDKGDLAASVADDPWIREVLAEAAAYERAIMREWLVGIGSRTAVSRLSHLLLELWFRLKAVGLTTGASLTLPLTQEVLGDALGLTSVSICRSLKTLRAGGLVDTSGRTLRLTDMPGMMRLCDFDPAYLTRTNRHWRSPGSPDHPSALVS